MNQLLGAALPLDVRQVSDLSKREVFIYGATPPTFGAQPLS